MKIVRVIAAVIRQITKYSQPSVVTVSSKANIIILHKIKPIL